MNCQTSGVECASADKGMMEHDGQGVCQASGKAGEKLVSLLTPPFQSCMHYLLHAKDWRRQQRRTTALQPRYSVTLSGYVFTITSALMMLYAVDMVYSQDGSLDILLFLSFLNYLEP